MIVFKTNMYRCPKCDAPQGSCEQCDKDDRASNDSPYANCSSDVGEGFGIQARKFIGSGEDVVCC